MIRYSILTVVVAWLVVYAWRDWFRVLCALILMMAVVEHPEMPKAIFGIPGMNPWNLVFLSVAMSWVAHRKVEDLRFDFTKPFAALLVLYVVIIVVGFIRGFVDAGALLDYNLFAGYEQPSKTSLISDELINTIKWAIPGILLFTGARTKERKDLAFYAIIGVSFLLSLQIIRWMPLSLLTDADALSDRALRVFDREIGYHRVDLAALLAGSFWGIFVYRPFIESSRARLLLLLAAFPILLALVLTGGRMGYATWAALGFGFALFKYRKYLVLAPIAAVLLLALVPAARERMMYGFSGTTNEQREELLVEAGRELTFWGIDFHAVTSGRALAWPYVIEKISERPWTGYGQLAMQREGITMQLLTSYGRGEAFPHPHNAYLEAILDNGIIGAVPLFLFFWLLVYRGFKVFMNRDAPYESAVAALALAFIGSQLVASIGSQSFYPKSGATLMWCAIGLELRILADLAAKRVRATVGVEQEQGSSPEAEGKGRRRRPTRAIAYQRRRGVRAQPKSV